MKKLESLEFVSPAAEREFGKEFPQETKETFAKSLQDVMDGREPSLPFKYLSTVGKGAIELIINGSPAYRVIYVTKHNNTLYILHSFSKTTSGVDLPAIKLAKKRYQEIPTGKN